MKVKLDHHMHAQSSTDSVIDHHSFIPNLTCATHRIILYAIAILESYEIIYDSTDSILA